MKLAILGATGFVGAPLLSEALHFSDLNITAIVRNIENLPNHERLTAVACDIEDEKALTEALKGHDAIIHAYHPGRAYIEDPEVLEKSKMGYQSILKAVNLSGVKRLLCVGGAASLKAPDGKPYIESSRWDTAFDPYKNAILGTRELYYLLLEEAGLDWVFLSPSEWLRPGERTGKFRYGKDDLLIDANNESSISLEDYALAMIDELRNPNYHSERFTVGY